MNPSHTERNRRAKRGFALVVTLSLMILLTVIAVGLLTLSTISLRSSSASEAGAIARANARLALMLAIGELQKEMGPDSAISANSDVLAAAPASPRILGAFPVDPAQADTATPASYARTLRETAKTGARWLVSSENPLTDPVAQTIQSRSKKTVPLWKSFDNAGAAVDLLGGQITTQKGTYAWRISDESQKATINAAANPTLANGTARTPNSGFTPPATSYIGTVDTKDGEDENQTTPVNGYTQLTPADAAKLVSLNQADIPYTVASNDDWFRKHNSYLTTSSLGLPVDVSHGRLKQDLSYYLETGGGLTDSESVIRASSTDTKYRGPKITGLDYTTADMPRFGLIRSWKDIGATTTGFDNGGTVSQESTNTKHGVHPVILRAGLYFSPFLVPTSPGSATPEVLTDTVTYAVDGKDPPTLVTAQGKYIKIRHAFYPRITIWNPTTVPITDEWFLYQTACMIDATYAPGGTNDNSAAFTDNLNKGWGQMRDFTASRQALIYLTAAMKRSAGIQKPYPDNGGPDGEAGALCFTFALKLEEPLLPGETRTFYPQSASNPIMVGYQQGDFKNIKSSNVASGNIMVSEPFEKNHYVYHNDTDPKTPAAAQQTKFYAATGKNMDLTRPAPTFVTARAYYGNGRMRANTNNNLNGAAYRLFKVNSSSEPTLLQEFFDCGVKNGPGGTAASQTPTISVNNTRLYDSPVDGANLPPGWALQKIRTDPDGEEANKRGHQIFLSYGREQPTTVNKTIFTDSSAKFSLLASYNPRARHIFPGPLEEQNFDPSTWNSTAQCSRQSIYSEGRPEAPWLRDLWGFDPLSSIENGYGSAIGSPGLLDIDQLPGTHGLVYPIYDFPRSQDSVLSLGEFQSVNFSYYPWQPGYAFGNARADARIPREAIVNSVSTALDHPYITEDVKPGPNRYIDISWLLNHSMWDRFFLSTIPYSNSGFELEAGTSLANSRHTASPTRDGLKTGNVSAFNEAAAHILVNGAFNVNCTSVPAWKQFLLSNTDRTVDVKNSDFGSKSSPDREAVFPRTLHPYTAGQTKANLKLGTPEGDKSAYTANRSITDDDAHLLAKAIVREVRLRGPFTSLSDFVNRRLVEATDTTHGEWAGLSGTLQTALDRVTTEDNAINNHLYEDSELVYTTSDVPAYLNQQHVTGRPAGQQQSRLAGTPGELTQGDLLRTLGPLLTVRGDTFTIRCYGEATDKGGKTLAKAWCEATVQRTADPVSPLDDIVTPNTDQYLFGRRIVITRFRWLSQNEI